MKKSIRIGDGIADFFGTHDGNIKYLESLLKVQVQIDGENNLTIDGNDHDVQLVERLVQDYAQLRSEGVKFDNGDLKSIIRIISEDTSQSLRGVISGAKTLQAGKRSVTPKTLNQKVYLEASRRFSRQETEGLVVLIADSDRRIRTGRSETHRLLLELFLYRAARPAASVTEPAGLTGANPS